MSETNGNGSAMVRRGGEDAPHAHTPGDFGDAHRAVVKDAYCAGATDIEFEVLWRGAVSRGLDPIKKQIHFVKRWDDMRGKDAWSSQVSIDGFRSIAEGTGKYDGQDEPEYDRDMQNDDELIARVRVYRKDIGRAFVGVARYFEFVQTKKNGDPTYMWKKMPYHMLGKCAEAVALRKAFPEQLSGLYTPDEMGGESTPEQERALGAGPSPTPGRVIDAEPISEKSPPKPPPLADIVSSLAAKVDLHQAAIDVAVHELRTVMSTRGTEPEKQQKAIDGFHRLIKARLEATNGATDGAGT